MITSKIDSSVKYKEDKICETCDKRIESDAILLTINDTDVITIIGKPDMKYLDKDIVFFPVYLMSDDKFISRIGIFEIPSDFLESVYSNNELNIEILNDPLIFSFVNREYLEQYKYDDGDDDKDDGYEYNRVKDDDSEDEYGQVEDEFVDQLERDADKDLLDNYGFDTVEDEDDDEDLLDNYGFDTVEDKDEDHDKDLLDNYGFDTVEDEEDKEVYYEEPEYLDDSDKDGETDDSDKDEDTDSEEEEEYVDDIDVKDFSISPDTPEEEDDEGEDEEEDEDNKERYKLILDDLVEQDISEYKINQTYKDSLREKSVYDIQKGKHWLNKLYKDNNFKVIDNEGGGDCFFAVIREAFKSIGKSLSVGTIRDILANEATQEIFDNYKQIYKFVKTEMNDKKREMNKIFKKNNDLKKKLKDMSGETKTARRVISDESRKLVEEYNEILLEYNESENMMEEYRFLNGVDTLSKFKEVIKSCKFWAETWAISTIERVFNIKMIILSTEKYRSGDYNSMVMCGQLNDEILRTREGGFTPKYYIMTEWSGNHYKTVEYDGKKMMEFEDIPYVIRENIVSNCLGRGDGPFGIINKFKTFESEFRDEKIKIDKELSSISLSGTKTRKSRSSKGASNPKTRRKNRTLVVDSLT